MSYSITWHDPGEWTRGILRETSRAGGSRSAEIELHRSGRQWIWMHAGTIIPIHGDPASGYNTDDSATRPVRFLDGSGAQQQVSWARVLHLQQVWDQRLSERSQAARDAEAARWTAEPAPAPLARAAIPSRWWRRFLAKIRIWRFR